MRAEDTCVNRPFNWATALRIQQPSVAPRQVKHIPLCNMGKLEYLYRDTILYYLLINAHDVVSTTHTFYNAEARLRTTIHLETFLHHINFPNLEIKCNKPIQHVNNVC